MATAIKKCKVCGGDYEYCHTLKRTAGVFRWQDVACCPEHGSIYLARIRESRMQKPTGITEMKSIAEIVSDFLSMDDFIDCEKEDEMLDADLSDEDDD